MRFKLIMALVDAGETEAVLEAGAAAPGRPEPPSSRVAAARDWSRRRPFSA